jgi:hypothetical protein
MASAQGGIVLLGDQNWSDMAEIVSLAEAVERAIHDGTTHCVASRHTA